MSVCIKLYGIPNCGSVKKARTWLEEQKLPYEFHDFKKQGLDARTLSAWLQHHDWTVLLNKKGTTWRSLSATEQAQVTDTASAQKIMLAHTSITKRPVLVITAQGTAQPILVGFDETQYEQHLKQHVK